MLQRQQTRKIDDCFENRYSFYHSMFSKKIVYSLCFLIVLTSCFSCNFLKKVLKSPKIEKAPGVTIPTDFDEVKKMASSPETNVIIKTVIKDSKESGESCHAGALCAVIVFKNLYDNFFPKKYTEVTIKQKNKITYKAKFKNGKEFLHAITFLNGIQKEYIKLDLKQLGKKIVVQLSEKNFEYDDPVFLSINKQIDLISLYEKKLEKTQDAKERALLYQEALTWLNKESQPLIFKALKNNNESQKAKRAIVQTICESQKSIPFDWLNQIEPEKNGLTSSEALFCLLENKTPQEKWLPFVKPTVHHMCTNDIDQNSYAGGFLVDTKSALGGIHTLEKITQWAHSSKDSRLTDEIQTHLKSCRKGPIQSLAFSIYNLPVTNNDLAEVFTINPKTTKFALKHLFIFKQPTHKPNNFTKDVIFLALEKLKKQSVNQNHALLTEKLRDLSIIIQKPWATEEELELLSHFYLKFPSYTTWDTQENIIKIFWRHRSSNKIKKALTLLEQGFQKDYKNRSAIALALVIFNEKNFLKDTIKGLADRKVRKNPKIHYSNSKPRNVTSKMIKSFCYKFGNISEIQDLVDLVLEKEKNKASLKNKDLANFNCITKLKL